MVGYRSVILFDLFILVLI